MGGDKGGDCQDDSRADFDARWQELAQELSPAIPPDLQDWASKRTDQAPSSASHLVWSPDLADHDFEEADDLDEPDAGEYLDDADWSRDLSDLAQIEDSLSPGDALATYGPRDWSPPEVEDHFEPPDPPPALAGDPFIVLGWIGLIGGIAAVFAWAIIGPLVPNWLGRAGLVAIVAGAAALIWKMPHSRDPEDTDDGAQV
ncbi:MAG: hypothetical protein LBS27_07460 [Bifidobacteriaceae bacterium]|nr:hypothetical protein [Bifidobacteriaceae bacterium]